MARVLARQYSLDVSQFVKVIDCESKFKPTVQSNHYYKDDYYIKELRGKRELSFGIAQIHEPSHPTITREQAYNPLYSLEWMAKQWASGNEEMWSCYNDLYK